MTVIQVGPANVTRIEETYAPAFDAVAFFPDWDPDVLKRHSSWMIPNHYDDASGFLKLSVHSWLIEVAGRRILVDTCVGNEKERPTRAMWHRMHTRYLERLFAVGVAPEQIDLVMCTHLHQDHVGWNTRLVGGRWVPTFPNARYIFSRAEYENGLARDNDPATAPANHGSFRDSILPVLDQNLADIIEPPYQLNEYLTIESAPGHTPGHIVVNLACDREQAVFPGDVIHHAIQLFHPDWNSFACADAAAARATRRRVLEHCVRSDAILAPTHFGAPFACHVERHASAFRPRFIST